MIHLVNKPLGATPLAAIEKLRVAEPALLEAPMTYAGRLDPMAEGLLIILSGDDRYRKAEFEKLSKVYRATILLGFTSDTYDALGLPRATGVNTTLEEVTRELSGLLGDHTLPFPVYSARRVAGKPLHYYANHGSLGSITIPTTLMRVLAVENIGGEQISRSSLLNNITESIALTHGDFRQAAIMQAWQDLLKTSPASTVLTVEVTLRVSAGTYIRSLANLLGERLQCGALLWQLKRQQVGNLTLEQAAGK